MKTLLWIFWPLAPGATTHDRLRLAAYLLLGFLPLALAFQTWVWWGPGIEQILKSTEVIWAG